MSDPSIRIDRNVEMRTRDGVVLFMPGMRIRVQIASTAFPHLARNTQTGGMIEEDAVPVVAENTVFHDAEHPSYVVIPVQPDPPPPAVMTHLLG